MAGYNRNLTLVYMTVRGLNSLLKVRAAVVDDNSRKPLMVTNRRSIHGMRMDIPSCRPAEAYMLINE